MEQYVKYLRKSRLDKDYADLSLEETLKRHDVILDKLAKERGYYIAKTYYEVVSGESIAARPEIQKLLEEIGQGIYAGVLVVDVDRLARGNSIDQGIISQTFQYSGTKIITPTKIYDPTNEFDEEYFEFGLFMSRREYKTITRRLIRGRESSASEGKYLGSIAPYGYKRVKLDGQKGYTLEINPDESKWVVKMFELTIENYMGTKQIANYLNDMQIPTRHGDIWTSYTITNILANPVYMGKIRRGYVQTTKAVKNGVVHSQVKHLRDFSQYTMYDGLHPALISEEDFYKAQDVRKQNTQSPRTKNESELKNPFAGLLYCGVCGKRIARTVTSSKQNSVPRIKCINHRNCHNASCAFDLIEKEILNALRDWLSGYIIEFNTTGYTSEINEHTTQVEQLDKELTKLNGQLNKAFELVEQGIYSLKTFQERRSKIESDIETLNEKKSLLEKQIEILQSNSETQEELIPKTQELLENYENLNIQERNDLLKEILVKIEYRKETKGEIELDIYPRFSKFIH